MTARIIVAMPQVPFLYGGAELHAELTVKALKEEGYNAELVSLPWVWTSDERALHQAMAWRLAEFDATPFGNTDLLICTKFPSYLARHHNKVAWIFHQERTLYDLYPTRFGPLGLAPDERNVREAFVEMDLEALAEAQALFTNSRNTADRLQLYSGVAARPLYAPPPRYRELVSEGFGDYLFFVGRLDAIKRLELTLEALALTRNPVELRVAGRGPERDRLQGLAGDLGVADRVHFLGFVEDDEVIRQLGNCFAMVLTPHDEDYGFTTLEAFFSGRPVVTTDDAGGVLEFVTDGETGFVVKPEPARIAERIDELYDDRALCERLGGAGRTMARETVRWDTAISALTETLR